MLLHEMLQGIAHAAVPVLRYTAIGPHDEIFVCRSSASTISSKETTALAISFPHAQTSFRSKQHYMGALSQHYGCQIINIKSRFVKKAGYFCFRQAKYVLQVIVDDLCFYITNKLIGSSFFTSSYLAADLPLVLYFLFLCVVLWLVFVQLTFVTLVLFWFLESDIVFCAEDIGVHLGQHAVHSSYHTSF